LPRKNDKRYRRKSKRGAGPANNLKRGLILLLLIVAGAIFYELYSDRLREEKRPPEVARSIPKHSQEKHREKPREEIPRAVPPIARETPRTETPVLPPGKKPEQVTEKALPVPPVHVSGLRIAILIDDIGGNLSSVKQILKIEAPISFAILPHTPRSVAAAEMIHQAGRDVLLHLPMEPQAYPREKPGPGALFTAMSEKELQQILSRDLDAVPHISGVNNHMGSRFTEDEEKMAIVMKELKSKGLFFIDSLTTPRSKAGRVSREIGIPFATRQIFIDNGQDYEKTCQNLLAVLNSKKGSHCNLILIGHPYSNTISALNRVVPELKSQGVEIVPVSSLVR